MKTIVRDVELWMHDLLYERERPDENTHNPDGCSCLSISMFVKENLILLELWLASGRNCHVIRKDSLEC